MATEEASSVALAWQDLEALFEEEPLPLELGPPASERDIAQCEQRLGLQFPRELRESYLRHNGGQLPDGFRLFDLNELEETWKELVELADEFKDDVEADELTEDGKICEFVHHAMRIPLATDDSTSMFVDCVPGPQGRVGQIIIDYSECDYLVLADGMNDLLTYLRALIDARKVVFDGEYGFAVTNRNDLRRRLDSEVRRLRKSVRSGRLGLLRCVLKADIEGVRTWMREGRGLDEQDRESNTAIFHAAVTGRWDICNLLIQAGADVNRAGNWTPLMASAYYGGAETVRELLRAGATVDAGGRFGENALHLASAEGNCDIVQLLLTAGADVNAADTQWRNTALTRAARSGRASVVRCLLEHGADVNATGAEGATALMQAAGAFNAGAEGLEIIHLLLTHGADTSVRNWEGTALDHAKKRNNQAIVDLLNHVRTGQQPLPSAPPAGHLPGAARRDGRA